MRYLFLGLRYGACQCVRLPPANQDPDDAWRHYAQWLADSTGRDIWLDLEQFRPRAVAAQEDVA